MVIRNEETVPPKIHPIDYLNSCISHFKKRKFKKKSVGYQKLQIGPENFMALNNILVAKISNRKLVMNNTFS